MIIGNVDLTKFRNGEISVNCETEIDAQIFVEQCFDIGITWVCEDRKVRWSEYGSKTVYSCYDGCELGYGTNGKEGSKIIIYRNSDIEVKQDIINHPSHYCDGGIETIDFIEAKKLNFNLGNAVKYISRAGKKGDKVEDLKKAVFYLNREIKNCGGVDCE